MISSLVLGVNGQDGSYLAEILLERGHVVTGVALQATSRWVDPTSFRYVRLDASDEDALDDLLKRTMPDQIYHMAAIHGSAGHSYEATWRKALALNVGSVHTCLEHIRCRSPATRLFYASSLKVFGNPPPVEVNEATPRVSTCLYSITKNAATDLIHQYRVRHCTFSCVGHFFNHDSPRRPRSYFLPRLTEQILASFRGDSDVSRVATLDFWCDWGSSHEFMELSVDVLQQNAPEDVVIATGQPVYAADLARALAEDLGVAPPVTSTQTIKMPPVRARIDGLIRATGRIPRKGALEVARWILADRMANDKR